MAAVELTNNVYLSLEERRLSRDLGALHDMQLFNTSHVFSFSSNGSQHSHTLLSLRTFIIHYFYVLPGPGPRPGPGSRPGPRSPATALLNQPDPSPVQLLAVQLVQSIFHVSPGRTISIFRFWNFSCQPASKLYNALSHSGLVGVGVGDLTSLQYNGQ